MSAAVTATDYSLINGVPLSKNNPRDGLGFLSFVYGSWCEHYLPVWHNYVLSVCLYTHLSTYPSVSTYTQILMAILYLIPKCIYK